MTHTEALKVIEWLCCDDFCEDLEMQMVEMPDSPLKTAGEKLTRIYRIAHGLNTQHKCYSVHEDWRKEAEETRAAIVAEEQESQG